MTKKNETTKKSNLTAKDYLTFKVFTKFWEKWKKNKTKPDQTKSN